MKDRLDKIDDKIFEMNIGIKRIDESVNRINTMLEELIAALHNYDDGLEMFDDGEPKRIPPCVGHEIESWNEEEGNKRMDIIGQNGNEGMHYTDVYNKGEYDDYGQRVNTQDKDKDNKCVVGDKGVVVEKKRNNGRESGMKVMGEYQVKTAHYKHIQKTSKSKMNSDKYITNHKSGLGNKLG